MNDIGFVQYSKNKKKNIIEAVWYYLNNNEKISGTGIAKGVFDNTFEGNFLVTYYDNNGSETSNFELKIKFEAEYYHLKWIKDGNIEYFGIGVECDNKLFAGWRKFKE